MKLLYNGKIQVYYLNTGDKPLSELLPVLDAEKFYTIVLNLFENIMRVKKNGFLSCQNIDISFQHIFVDPATYGISLVYLPLSKKFYDSVAEFENDLRTSLIKVVQNVPALSSRKTERLVVDLSNGMISFEDIYMKIKRENKLDEEKDDIIPRHKNVKLVATNAPLPFEIEITKDEFLIGRKPELVDGVISFNRTVGRMHCKIVRQENYYAIIDLQSSNGTYINKVRLQPEHPCQIKDGDVLRLASSEFKVTFY